MKHITFIITLFVCFMSAVFAQETTVEYELRYKAVTEGTPEEYSIFIEESEDRYTLTAPADEEAFIAHSDLEGNGRYVIISNQTTSETRSFTRKGEIILMKKNDTKSEIQIGNEKWRAGLTILRDFLTSENKKEDFFFINIADAKAMKMRLIKQGVEEVDVNGEQSKAMKVRMTIPGPASLLWSSYYWYRLSDGVMVKSEELRGPPGTPTTFVTLIEKRRIE